MFLKITRRLPRAVCLSPSDSIDVQLVVAYQLPHCVLST